MLYCFLDTNIFIHCQDIQNIDWKAELGASQVCLVIAPVVFEELDVFKDDHRNSRKRDRARRAIKLLEATLTSPGQIIREGVSLQYGEELYRMDFGGFNLNPDNKDDRLVASTIRWTHEHTEDEVILVSHDSGPRMKAIRLKLRSMKLSGKYRLLDQVDPLEKENRELRNELLKLQNTLPKLEFGFRHKDGSTTEVLKLERGTFDTLTNEKEIQKTISTEYEHHEDPWNRQTDEFGLPRFGLLMPTAKLAREYQNDLSRWTRNDFRNYLIRKSRYRACMSQNIVLPLLLKNTGSAPAEGTRVDITVRGCRAIYDEMPEEPVFPVAPNPADYVGYNPNAKAYVQIIGGGGAYLNQTQFNETPLELNMGDNHQLGFSIDMLLHHDSYGLGDHIAVIDNPVRYPVVIVLEYLIITENHPDKLEGELKVIIDQEET